MCAMNKKKLTVGIIDLKINNLFSIYNSCVEADYKPEIIDKKKKSFNYDIVILPGVGSFNSGMNFLKKNNYDEKIYDYLEQQNSFIYGICLGMQLFFEKGNEFKKANGLKLINGEVVRFKDTKQPINIGWSKFRINKKIDKSIFGNLDQKYFYYVHSFYSLPKNSLDIFSKSTHNKIQYCSAVRKGKIFGTQFHPEKSQSNGLKLLINFFKK